MGNLCCDEQKDCRSQLTEEKLKRDENPKVIERPIIKPNDFQSRRYLGKGSFGSVVMVERKNAKGDKVYAMKIIDKQKIKQMNLLQTDYIEKVLGASHNPFLAQVHSIFQNQQKIYIIMEFVEGGDLYYYLAHEKFSEELIRKLVPQVIEAICFLHANDIIYRDLKPENVLVTSEGHLKLTDYGLSRLIVGDEPLVSYAGVLEYMAPEVIEQKGYDKMVDLWTLGIFIYELLHGFTPFKEETEQATKQSIMNKMCEIIENCSQEYTSLIYGLLAKDPRSRIDMNSLRQHPFFKGTDWKEVRERLNEPPMKDIKQRINIRYKGPKDCSVRIFESINEQTPYTPVVHEFIQAGPNETNN